MSCNCGNSSNCVVKGQSSTSARAASPFKEGVDGKITVAVDINAIAISAISTRISTRCRYAVAVDIILINHAMMTRTRRQ